MFKFNKQRFAINVYSNFFRCFVVIGKAFALLLLLNIFQSLTLAQCADCNIPTNGLVAWYKAEGNTNDSVGTRHASGVFGPADYSAGKVGQSFHFTSLNPYPLQADTTGLPYGDRTMDMWVYVEEPSEFTVFFAGYGVLDNFTQVEAFFMGTSRASHLFVSTTTDYVYFAVGCSEQSPILALFNCPALFPVSEWHHIATTAESNLVKLYFDGEMVASGVLPLVTPNPDNPHQLLIGRVLEGSLDTWSVTPTRIDELKIYDRALSPAEIQSIYNAGLVAPESAPTSTGSDVTVQTTNATLTFDEVTSGGTTSVTSIDPATAGDVPGGFALADLAFEVSTTATFTGSVTTCFNVPTVNDQTEFLNLRVLHNENGTLVDRTSSHDYPSRKICATTTSFSPFYLATVGKKVQSLFDRSRAFKSGRTVPVKVKILDGSDQNISSATLPLTARALRRIGSNTTSDITDAGNSNPDFTFRYDSALQGYIYNLKTTGLAAGRYVLSFYAGSDTTFFYTVQFEVR